MTLWKWSTDPATNGAADSTCPWPEGMAPSQVNDSARGTMAAIAKYRDDVSGQIVTGGTSSAYTVTSNQGFDTLAHLDGAMIAFVPHADSSATPTLSVDGLTAKPLRGWTGIDLLAGVLKAGTPYAATYNHTSGEFVLFGYYVSPGEIPIGSGIEYWGSTVPSDNFMFPYGQAISRTDYPTCFARLGSTFGSGDGSTTFNLPDKRGRVSAGKDDMGGTAAGRLTTVITGTSLGYPGGTELHTLTPAQLPSITSTNSSQAISVSSTVGNIPYNTTNSGNTGSGGSFNGPYFASSISIGTITSTGNNSISVTSTGTNGSSHNNVQPTIICNYIIRVK